MASSSWLVSGMAMTRECIIKKEGDMRSKGEILRREVKDVDLCEYLD